MGQHLLTLQSRIQCPHSGQAVLQTANTKVFADRALVLLEPDLHQIAGCPFTVGNKYSPCVTLSWSMGAGKVLVNGQKVLLKNSQGSCKSGEQAIQGQAQVVQTQTKVSGL